MADVASCDCLPTFILAGQSNMLGFGTNVSELPPSWRDDSDWRAHIWSFGFQHGFPRRTRDTGPCADGWVPFAVGGLQRQFCLPGLRNSSAVHRSIECKLRSACETRGHGPEMGFARVMSRHRKELRRRLGMLLLLLLAPRHVRRGGAVDAPS